MKFVIFDSQIIYLLIIKYFLMIQNYDRLTLSQTNKY